MLDVIIALCPAVIVSFLYYGLSEIAIMAVSVASCVVLEWAITKYMLKRPSTTGDLSAIVTGILLAMNLPPTCPLWVVFIGALVAIAVAKMTFGGIGQNIFNPAITGRVFLLVSFPTFMTDWTVPAGFISNVDAFSGATLLGQVPVLGALEADKLVGLQTFFRNPIAGPFVLGISSGAKLCVAILLILFAMRAGIPGSISLISAAFFGALLSMGFVLLISARMRGKPTLIVAGIMIGYICSAATDFLVTFADDAQIVSLHNWSKGSFSGMDWGDVRVMSLLTVLCFAGILLLAKPISAYRLGEEYARSLGVDVLRLQVLLVLYSSLLAACVTAYAGPVSFVGIAVPQLIRALLRTERPQLLIPACFLGGGIFCLVSDLIARSIFSPAELSISSVTAVFGAPVVIIILLRRKGAV